MINLNGLGERLKFARIKCGYTQTQAGQLVGLSYGTLSGYERNYRNPDNETLIKLSKLYNVDVTWLLGIDNNSEFEISDSNDLTNIQQKIIQIVLSMKDPKEQEFIYQMLERVVKDK